MNDRSYPNKRLAAAGYCLLEFFLTASAAWVLWVLAQPLALPGISEGLGQRYAADGMAVWQAWPAHPDWVLPLLPKPARALWLNRHAGLGLAVAAAVGWLALWVARRQWRGAAWVCMALWLMVAAVMQVFGWPAVVWGAVSGFCCLNYIALGLLHRPRPSLRVLRSTSLTAAFGWPGWVLFSGIGLLWVSDFAARGPVKCAFLGLYQADALWLSNLLLLLVAAGRGGLMVCFARLASGLYEFSRRRRASGVLIGAGLGLALSLGWLGRAEDKLWLPGLASPHISGELLRSWACLSCALFAYRVGEWGASPARAQRALLGLGCVGGLVAVGLVVSGDTGPGLVMFLAGVPTFGLPWLYRLLRCRWVSRSWLLALVLGLAGFASWSYSVEQVAPAISSLAKEREYTLNNPFHAASPYLAQLRWLLDASPVFGFGLGRVPWCGAMALVGAKPCTDGSGAPRQMASDYATAGLSAVLGMPVALLSLAGLLTWLVSLAVCRIELGAPPWARLQAWVVLAFALCDLAQVFITAGASFGLLPLTGVTLPLLGYGGASLCFNALWLGLALNPADRRGQP